MKRFKYNITDIQNDFDIGMSWDEVEKKYGVSHSYLGKLTQRGLLKSNIKNKNQWRDGYTLSKNTLEKIRKKSIGKKHSEETKKRLSEIRIKYLTEHPDKVPYVINHSSKKSWPENVFENALLSSNITGWKYKYRNGIYEYDFAFPLEKIDVEIDGGTHKTKKVKKIDERRDKFSKENGWRVLRFEAEKVKKDVINCIIELKRYL